MKVPIGTLKKGDKFTSADGDYYVYERVDGVSTGVHHVVGRNGRATMFAGCADVEPGWNDLGWFAKERAERTSSD